MKKGFELCGPHGTQFDACGYGITFANGWTISVQWGPINFGSNRRKQWNAMAHSAEIAIFDSQNKYHQPEGWSGDVCGYLTPDGVLHWMQYTANQPSS